MRLEINPGLIGSHSVAKFQPTYLLVPLVFRALLCTTFRVGAVLEFFELCFVVNALSFFRSNLSCSRPADLLASINSSRLRNCVSTPANVDLSRFFQAVSKSTPLIRVSISMRLGGSPQIYITPGSLKVSWSMFARGAPKASRAR